MNPSSPIVQMSSSNESITTIISRPYQNQYGATDDTAQKLPGSIGHRQPGILHEYVRRRADIGTETLQLQHLLNGYYLHFFLLSLRQWHTLWNAKA